MQEIKILFDGWPLVNAPNSAAAIHLRTLLIYAPDNIQPILALPEHSNIDGIDKQFELIIKEEKDLGAWQQKRLPRLLKSVSANIIHSCIDGAALFGRHKTVLSPSALNHANQEDSRLSLALGQGGMARANILWPADIDQSTAYANQHFLPPIAHPDFFGGEIEIDPKLNIPETFILHHGAVDSKSIHDLLEAWTWAAASVGEYFPLLMLGLGSNSQKKIKEQLIRFQLEETVHILPEISWRDLSALYRNCNAVIANGQDELWGASARLALAAGKSIAGFNSTAKEKLLGNAAYLVSDGDLRAFGAAIITVLVDEKVWEKLGDAAQNRSAKWDPTSFTKALGYFYEGLI